MALQPVRGTQDLLPEIQSKHNLIISTARELAARFGFYEMSTPIFEFSDVFKRTLGTESDIVNKEMYTFADRNGEELTLRPEGTAPIVRAFISEGLSQRAPLKLFYQGPMFRYERPQKGRYRQFHQIGVEILGAASPFADAECIALGWEILKALKVEANCTLEINSIGDVESRTSYVEALKAYLQTHVAELSADSQRRLTTNPLRILDSKDENDRRILAEAPRVQDHYTELAREFFATVTKALDAFQIPYTINPFLVRGLDYYTHCVFEFKTTQLGAQDALISGGRYDQLVKQMGGPDTPGVGFGAGIERLSLLLPEDTAPARPVVVVPVHGSVEAEAFRVAHSLRVAGFYTEVAYSGNMSKRMKRASNQKAWATLLLGPDEVARGEITLKLMDSSEQKVLRTDALVEALRQAKPKL